MKTFSEKLINELHNLMQKHLHAIRSPNVSDSIFVKINGNLVNKQKDLFKILVQDLHNYLILPMFQGYFFGARNDDGKVCIGDTSLSKYKNQ